MRVRMIRSGLILFLCCSNGARAQLPPPPVPPQNPITEAKRVLGKMLFWDTQLSSDNSVSCGTCHAVAVPGCEGGITTDSSS